MDVKDLIRSARLPERTVAVCLRADLVDEYERVEREHAAGPVYDSLAAGGRHTRDLEDRLAELRQVMAEHTLTVTLRALTHPAFRALVDEHPPRQTPDGGVDDRDAGMGVNRNSFPAALVRACAVAPVLDAEDWQVLLEERLTDAQFDALFEAAWTLNRRGVDVPFSSAGSPPTRTS